MLHFTIMHLQRISPEEWESFHRKCPLASDRLFGRKYHLPNYRQGDYYSQDMINELWLEYLLAYGSGMYGLKDEVNNVSFFCFTQVLRYGKQTYFLEKELAQAFVRTKLPLDMQVDDIEWKYNAFRVYLPKGTLTIEREGSPKNIMYMDICRVGKNREMMMPEELQPELDAFVLPEVIANNGPFLKPFSKISGNYDWDGFIITGHLDHHESLAGFAYTLYATVKPWTGVTFRDLAAITDQLKPNNRVTRDELDDRLLKQLEAMGLTILLFLSAFPLEYDAHRILRKKEVLKKRTIPELAEARFIGASQVRARYLTATKSTPGKVYTTPTGRTLPPHGVAGHWKRQPFGEHSQQRKLIFIHPYLTGQPEEEKQ